jgi:thiol-disulfide isomerase/thioredoxin
VKWLLLFIPLFVYGWELPIRSLKSSDVVSFQSLIQNKTLAILFQADCLSCRAQIQELDCLKDKTNVIILGAFSHEDKLRREVSKYYKEFKAYYADKSILKKLQISEVATPQILVFDKNQIRKSIGKKKCKDLLTYQK